MTRIEKKDLFRLVGEELRRLYRLRNISIYPEYDTSVIEDDTNLSQKLEEVFVSPYRRVIQLESDDSKVDELQVVLSAIRSTIREYDIALKENRKRTDAAYKMTVEKALNNDRGFGYDE